MYPQLKDLTQNIFQQTFTALIYPRYPELPNHQYPHQRGILILSKTLQSITQTIPENFPLLSALLTPRPIRCFKHSPFTPRFIHIHINHEEHLSPFFHILLSPSFTEKHTTSLALFLTFTPSFYYFTPPKPLSPISFNLISISANTCKFLFLSTLQISSSFSSTPHPCTLRAATLRVRRYLDPFPSRPCIFRGILSKRRGISCPLPPRPKNFIL